MKFQKINKIENVLDFEPKNGSYSFTKDNLNYLCINNNFIQKEECALELSLRGEYMYVWYASLETVEIYSNENTLISTIEGDVFLLNKETLYIGYSLLELNPFQSYRNLKNPFTNELILKENIPYQLYVEKDIIIAYSIFKGEIKRINTDTETLWQFTIASLGDSPYPDEEDKIGEFLGITNNYLWIVTNLGRLIALDIETGEVQKVASPHTVDEKYNYHLNKAFGHIYIKEEDGNLYCMSYNMVTIIDTQTFTIKEEYNFREEDPEEMGQYESVYKPLLQGNYFTFIGSKHKEYGGIGWIGIFDYKARKLVWEYELLPFEERKATRNRLVAPQPLYMSGNKLYIKDIKDNLYIFEREE
ncbi:hypothetical protein [Capnocytophaga gingivalis]|uniref:hypothetical protein n=1 Tax=Capnocytophaga gingivalis TaxID=1017 RepID=UPI003C7832FC